MNCEKLTNTTSLLPDREVRPGEVIENVQICPVGDFPHGDSQQHCTLEALRNVVDDWKRSGSKEILVDFEHRSEETDDTSAAAWVNFIMGAGIMVLNMFFRSSFPTILQSPINCGAFAMLQGFIVVPVVSIFTKPPKRDLVDAAFECYEEKVLVTAKHSLRDN